jgi:hypothetical protein
MLSFGRVRDSAGLDFQGSVSLFAFPEPDVITRIPVRQAGLTKHLVLKENLQIMFGARLEEAALYAAQRVKCFGRGIDMRTKRCGNSLFEDVA